MFVNIWAIFVEPWPCSQEPSTGPDYDYVFQFLTVFLSSLVRLCLLNVYRFTDQNFVRTFQFIQAWNISCPSYSLWSAQVSNFKWVVRTSKTHGAVISNFLLLSLGPNILKFFSIRASYILFPQGEMPDFIPIYWKGNIVFKTWL